MPLIKTEEQKRKEAAQYGTAQGRFNAVLATAKTSAPRNNPRFNTTPVRSTAQVKEPLDDLDASDSFQQDAQVFLDWSGTNDDIFETLRDSDYNIVKGVNLAMTIGNAPDYVKQSYARLRTRFDNADTGSFNQWIEATKDIGIDLISDPTLIASLLAAPFTGGASVGARTAAVEAAKAGLKRRAIASAITGATLKTGAATGFLYAGADAWARESVAESVGLTESVSGAQVMASAVIGGVAGGVMGKLVDSRAIAKAERMVSAEVVEKQAVAMGDVVVDEATKEWTPSTVRFWDRPLSWLSAHTAGKPAGVMEPMAKVSKTAHDYMQKFAPSLGRNLSNPINPTEKPIRKTGYFELLNNRAGVTWTEVKKNFTPVMMNGKRLTPQMNDALTKYTRDGILEGTDPAVIKAGNRIARIIDKVGDDLLKRGLIKQKVKNNFFSRTWMRDAIERNPDGLARLLVEDGEAGSMKEGRKIVAELLDKRNQLGSGFSGSGPRKFTKIVDDNRYKDFLSGDFMETTFNYILASEKKIAGYEMFSLRDAKGKITKKGAVKNLVQFKNKVIPKIRKEMADAGQTMSLSQEKELVDLYRYATGEDLVYFGGKMQGIKDWTALGFQMAMLPLATLSSITESIIPLTRVNTPTYLKGMVSGMNAGFKKITIDLLDAVKIKHNLTTPQVFNEMNRMLTAMDTSFGDYVERLSGSDLRNSTAKKLQNYFFNVTGLTPWTRAVSAGTFNIGKLLIRDNLRDLSKEGVDLSSRNSLRLINELADIGIDYRKGLEWYKAGANEAGNFYQNSVLPAANVFLHDILGNTSREAGVKPHFMGHPMADILTQFMAYPAYFSNTPLKRMATDIAEHPIRGGVKVASAALIMTEMARWGNWVRTHGESERGVQPHEARLNGLIRWGGNGLVLDMMHRAQKASEAAGTPLAGVTGFMGPLPGTFLQSLMYRKGFVETAGELTPFKAAGKAVLGQETMDDYSTWLREKDKQLAQLFKGKQKPRGY